MELSPSFGQPNVRENQPLNTSNEAIYSATRPKTDMTLGKLWTKSGIESKVNLKVFNGS